MKVYLKAIGDLRDYFGKEPSELELRENACVSDLYQRIELEWGAGFPAYLWDFKEHRFRGPVVLVLNQKAVQDPNAPLWDGVEISVVRAIAGG